MMVKCDGVKKYFKGRRGIVKAVDGVSFKIDKGDAFGLVGESGCGKTTLGKMILGILKPDSGRITLDTDKIQVIFQDPYNSLDPKMKVRDIVAEGLLILGSGEIKKRIEQVLDLVKLPKEALKKYPHEFSGGERQRIALARAVITAPEFIVCDEPVSSLDAAIQLEVLRLLKDIQKRFNITYLFISHDLKAVKFICRTIAVMRYGKILESGAGSDIYSKPSHPYTKALLLSAFYDTMKK
ncbi:MAG: ABC transporter ATP-binding protein [Candidatus Omnitrophica bacterium]|nr:ABC transporter ATP-binding protein [Candidatus Omnitrophota bacterium]